jgi:hypothetical protein
MHVNASLSCNISEFGVCHADQKAAYDAAAKAIAAATPPVELMAAIDVGYAARAVRKAAFVALTEATEVYRKAQGATPGSDASDAGMDALKAGAAAYYTAAGEFELQRSAVRALWPAYESKIVAAETAIAAAAAARAAGVPSDPTADFTWAKKKYQELMQDDVM